MAEEKQEMTLLQKTKAVVIPIQQIKRTHNNEQLLELALAYIDHEVSIKQIQVVIKVKNVRSTLANVVFTAIYNGDIKITKVLTPKIR